MNNHQHIFCLTDIVAVERRRQRPVAREVILRLISKFCLPKPFASGGQPSSRSTQHITSERHLTTPHSVQLSKLTEEGKPTTRRTTVNKRYVFPRAPACSLSSHAAFAIQLPTLRHEIACSWFRNSDVVARRVDANLADLRTLHKQTHDQCSVLPPFQEHSMSDCLIAHGHPATQSSQASPSRVPLLSKPFGMRSRSLPGL